jgi:hypothetical protein
MNAEQVPPHFHKLDRISETDVIPDGQIHDELPLSAEEGRFAVKKVGSSYELHRFVDNDWRRIGEPPAAGFSWEHVDSGIIEAADALDSLVISGLAGDTDGMYRLHLVARFASAEPVFHLRLNADSSSHYVAPESGSALTEMNLTNDTKESYFVEVLLQARTGGARMMSVETVSFTDAASKAFEAREGIFTDTVSEITEIDIAAGQDFDSLEWWKRVTN